MYLLLATIILAFTFGCDEKSSNKAAKAADSPKPTNEKLVKFIPAGYDFFSEAQGDLNGDGADDYALIIVGTDKNKIVPVSEEEPDYGTRDINEYGVMIFFSDGDDYQLAAENRQFLGFNEYDRWNCANGSSFSCSIKGGNLYIKYDHINGCGPAREKTYTFRYRNSEFELIGYDQAEIITTKEETSINFPAKKQLNKICIGDLVSDDGCEDFCPELPRCTKYKETWSAITVKGPILLQKLANRDDFYSYMKVTSLIDTRDNKTYKITEIGRDTWMAENLNYQPKNGKSWCYENKPANCKTYGRLYTFKAAEAACPESWHLPSWDEWDYLAQVVGGVDSTDDNGSRYWAGGAGKRLKAKLGWKKEWGGNGTDDFGFSALPGGAAYNPGGLPEDDPGYPEFNDGGIEGKWWTSTTNEDGGIGIRYISGDYLGVSSWGKWDEGKSVRCVRD